MEAFVARQPIFDRKKNIFGYELLFRSGLDNFYTHTDGDYATSKTIADSFLVIGTSALTHGHRAFINFTRNLIIEEAASLLPHDIITVEILENVEPDQEVIQACRKLKELNYVVALDDFVLHEKYKPLLQFADIIKVDFLQTDEDQRRSLVQTLGSPKIKFLAEKVETREEFEQAIDMGYALFQGYFFSKPVIISSKDVPGYKVNYLQILSEIQKSDVTFDRIEGIIRRDTALTYKLLRLINSAYFGLPQEVDSIKHALMLLGLSTIKRWASLFVLGGIGKDKPEELMITSIVRAQFCESLAPMAGLTHRGPELFMMGMLSLIDAFMDRPMADILADLPISEDIKAALQGDPNRLRQILDLMVSYERGEWKAFSEASQKLQFDEKEIPGFYFKAVASAHQIFDQSTDGG